MAKDQRTYIRVHDGMPDHPKIDPLSDAAFRLLITTWCWCSRHRTDGKVPAATWGKRGNAKTRRQLLEAGLAEQVGSDVQMHDYLDWQRSAAEIIELSEHRREAGKQGGKEKARRLASAKANAKQPGSKPVADTETDTKKDQTLGRDPSRRDPMWDAILDACGLNPAEITEPQRGATNKALAQLRAVNATPAGITARAVVYARKFPGAALTPTALAKQWAACAPTQGSNAMWRESS